MAKTTENWRLILQAAQALTASGQAPFTRLSVYEWIWRRYPRSEHDRPSLDPVFQGMVSNATGGPASSAGSPLRRIDRGRCILASPGPVISQPVSTSRRQHSGPWPQAASRPAPTELEHGLLFKFADWPNDAVPLRAAGVYTVWREDQLMYVGMSGRGAQAEDFVAPPGQNGKNKAKWLWTRLDSHASGRRSGDQFNVYVCDRFVVPVLTPEQQRDVRRGILLLDQLTKNFIHEHLGYRFQTYPSGDEAFTAERKIRDGSLSASRPYLNPL